MNKAVCRCIMALADLVCPQLEKAAGGNGHLCGGSFRRKGMERAKDPRNG